jgi:hypothetical protein
MHTGLSCILVARFFDSQEKLNIEQGVLKTGGIYERILRHRANKAGRFSKYTSLSCFLYMLIRDIRLHIVIPS